MINKSLSYYLKKSENLTPHDPEKIKKIAILSNFTINGLSNVLQVMSNEQMMDIDVYEAPYNQFKQEIVNSASNWHVFKPELSFIILDLDSLLGDTKFRFYSMNEKEREQVIKQITTEFKELVLMASNKQSGKIVISNFTLPHFSPLGIFDYKTKFSLRDLANSLNSEIRNLSLELSLVYVLELDSFFNQFGKLNITDEKFRYVADMKISPSFLPYLAESMMSFIKPLLGKTKKCIVLDLDNTLWGGIIGEDGIAGIKLDEKPPGNSFLEFQKVLLEFHNRGIILAINSKNNPEDVKEVFSSHPNMALKEHHFAIACINWNDKASNLVTIAKELNIGTESIVYFDDDPLNRELVKQKFPEVLVVDLPHDPSLYAQTLRNLNDFHTFQITEEDFEKGKMYHQQQLRKNMEKQFSNMDDFLASLDMEVIATNVDEFTIPRIAQLTMKTNQFNLTTNRYSEENIRKMANNPDFLIKTFSVHDKFGDNGLTGLYIVKKENQRKWIIDTFLMSCRIMGRNIEQVMFSDLLEEAKKSNIDEIIGLYTPTKKNEVIKDLYTNLGFVKINENRFVLNNLNDFKCMDISYIKKN